MNEQEVIRDERARPMNPELHSGVSSYNLKDYDINIRFLSVGCIISVGCRLIAFETIEKAMEELNKFVTNPTEEAERWNNIFKNQ